MMTSIARRATEIWFVWVAITAGALALLTQPKEGI
jgi:hypothetical protein